MEGARWDTNFGTITDSHLKELYPVMPIMLIKAITQDKQESRNIFSNIPYQAKNQEFLPSKPFFKKKSRYFKIIILVTRKKEEAVFKIFSKEISRKKKDFGQYICENVCI